MFKKNVGGLDRTVRLIGGAAMILIGLFPLGGWRGKSAGKKVAFYGLFPLMSGVAGFCGLYVPFGISTAREK